MTTAYEFSCRALSGKDVDLGDYKGKISLIVNTASKCGFTPQYQGLEELYQKYHEQGVEVLGFPCNQFGKQEPGEAKDIGEFCEINYGVSFQMFEKIDVNGSDAHPLYEHLKNEAPGLLGSKKVKWNFTKFLVDQDGRVVKRYAPAVKPDAIHSDIEQLLESGEK
ncbi:MAG: glutathione peroxidase [Gammaproteobacteria bacterium]